MRLLLSLPIIMLAGCAAIAPAPAPTVTPAEEVIAYMGSLRALNDAALTAEARRQRAAVRGEREGDIARLKAALALSLAESADEAEILALVDPVAKRETNDASLKTLAGFLHGMASDRRRLKESAAAANARLRDERRSQEQLRSAASAANERATQLQQKLDALTALERSLSVREPAR